MFVVRNNTPVIVQMPGPCTQQYLLVHCLSTLKRLLHPRCSGKVMRIVMCCNTCSKKYDENAAET